MSKDPPQVTAPSPEPAPKAPRRPEEWSAEERLRVVVDSSKLTDDELGAFLRREGLHEATLKQWRASALESLGPQRSTRAEQKRVQELEKQLRRKDKALAEAAALLVLQKNHRGLRPTCGTRSSNGLPPAAGLEGAAGTFWCSRTRKKTWSRECVGLGSGDALRDPV